MKITFTPKFRVRVHPNAIQSVLARVVERGVHELVLADDRGGSGCWELYFIDSEMTKSHVRKLVGNDVEIEEIKQ